jgi:hypothetical protein
VFTRPAIFIEEGADHAGDVLGFIEPERMPGAVGDVRVRLGGPRREHARVAQRNAWIVVAADDQGQ